MSGDQTIAVDNKAYTFALLIDFVGLVNKPHIHIQIPFSERRLKIGLFFKYPVYSF